MSETKTAAHHRYSKGDRVRVKVSRDFGQGPRWMEGRVIEVFSRGLRVHLDEPRPGKRGHEMAVSFSCAEFVEEQARHDSKVIELPPPRVPTVAIPPPPRVPSPPAQPEDDGVDAWIEMGRELLAPLDRAIEVKAREVSETQAEIGALEDLLAAQRGELAALEIRRTKVRKVVDGSR